MGLATLRVTVSVGLSVTRLLFSLSVAFYTTFVFRIPSIVIESEGGWTCMDALLTVGENESFVACFLED